MPKVVPSEPKFGQPVMTVNAFKGGAVYSPKVEPPAVPVLPKQPRRHHPKGPHRIVP